MAFDTDESKYENTDYYIDIDEDPSYYLDLPETDDIIRYTPTLFFNTEEYNEGDYVKYEDHIKILRLELYENKKYYTKKIDNILENNRISKTNLLEEINKLKKKLNRNVKNITILFIITVFSSMALVMSVMTILQSQ